MLTRSIRREKVMNGTQKATANNNITSWHIAAIGATQQYQRIYCLIQLQFTAIQCDYAKCISK